MKFGDLMAGYRCHGETAFDVSYRCCTKRGADLEHDLMPDAKIVPARKHEE